MSDSYHLAAEELARGALGPADFADPFLSVVPASGAAVSTLGVFLGSETIAASNRLAAVIDELQFDLGEGPCWQAMRSGAPVLHPDFPADRGAAWPLFTEAVLERDIRSLFAFPLMVGSLRFGAVDLYSHRPLTLSADQAQRIASLAGIVGRRVLQNALSAAELDDAAPPTAAFPRRIVHQATGMVMAQLALDAVDAELVIQGHAFAASRSMMEIAQDIVERRLVFGVDATGIEEAE